jgi:hypothetical protein
MEAEMLDAETMRALADFPARLQCCLAVFPAQRLRWRPASWEGIPSEMMTPLEQACHVRDIECDGSMRGNGAVAAASRVMARSRCAGWRITSAATISSISRGCNGCWGRWAQTDCRESEKPKSRSLLPPASA